MDHLYDLIQTGQVEIGDLSLQNIEAVRQEHFRHRDIRFFRNYKDFFAAFDLEADYRGAGATKAKKVSCGIWY